MRIRLLPITLFTLLLVSARAEAQFTPQPAVMPGEDYRAEFGVMFWKPTPELLITTDRLGPGNSNIDFVSEFGIEDKMFPEFRAVLKLGRKHKLRVSYVQIKYEEDAVINRTLILNGRPFNIGVNTNAELKWDLWRFGYEWDFVSRERGFFGLLAEVKYNKVEAALSNVFRTESTEATAPVPAIGVIGRGYLAEPLSVTVEFTGFKLPDSISKDFEAKFLDFDVYGTLNLGRNVGVQGGYRSVVVDYVVDADAGNLKMKGPYVGGVLRF